YLLHIFATRVRYSTFSGFELSVSVVAAGEVQLAATTDTESFIVGGCVYFMTYIKALSLDEMRAWGGQKKKKWYYSPSF
ncbi:MAG: hypothetical protein KDH97_24305, partial [Calditrichaeota bacterium]|nr:hypothetical protein [Calditrichota bacterium]